MAGNRITNIPKYIQMLNTITKVEDLLRFVKPDQLVEVISNGKGLLKNLTLGKIYKVIRVERDRFFIKNDSNNLKSYHLKSDCWFKVVK
jgi:hypothetical protein